MWSTLNVRSSRANNIAQYYSYFVFLRLYALTDRCIILGWNIYVNKWKAKNQQSRSIVVVRFWEWTGPQRGNYEHGETYVKTQSLWIPYGFRRRSCCNEIAELYVVAIIHHPRFIFVDTFWTRNCKNHPNISSPKMDVSQRVLRKSNEYEYLNHVRCNIAIIVPVLTIRRTRSAWLHLNWLSGAPVLTPRGRPSERPPCLCVPMFFDRMTKMENGAFNCRRTFRTIDKWKRFFINNCYWRWNTGFRYYYDTKCQSSEND